MKQLTKKNKVAIALAPIIFILITIMDANLLKFYTDFIGLSAGLFGRLMMMMIVVSIANHLWIGILLDKKQIYLKALKASLFFAATVGILLIMASPDWTEPVILVYLAVLVILWDMLKVLFGLSYAGYFFNVTQNTEDRTGVTSIRQFLGLITSFLTSTAAIVLFTGEFKLHTMRLIVAGIIITGLLLALYSHRSLSGIDVYTESGEVPVNLRVFFKCLKTIGKTKIYRRFFMAAFFINAVTSYYFVHYIYYMDNVVVYQGVQAALPDIAGGILQAMVYAVLLYLTKKFGSRNTLRGGAVISLLSFISLYFATSFIMVLISYATLMIGIAMFWALSQPMLGHLIDLDEIQTGVRKSGMMNAIYGILLLPSYNMMAILTAWLLEYSGYNGAQKVQSPETTQLLKAGMTLFPAFLLFIAICLLSLLPLTKKAEQEMGERLTQAREQRQKGRDAHVA